MLKDHDPLAQCPEMHGTVNLRCNRNLPSKTVHEHKEYKLAPGLMRMFENQEGRRAR